MDLEECFDLSNRWRRFLPARYNSHAPQNLLMVYLFHREGHLCQGCRYNYAGHSDTLALANATWAFTEIRED